MLLRYTDWLDIYTVGKAGTSLVEPSLGTYKELVEIFQVKMLIEIQKIAGNFLFVGLSTSGNKAGAITGGSGSATLVGI